MNRNRLRMFAIVQCCLLAGSLSLAACGDDDDDAGISADAANTSCADHDEAPGPDAGAEPEVGTPSGATCPTDNKPTYDNFGKQFMTDYCVRCHSSKLVTCDARMNAPLGHDFDTKLGILAVANHIDEKAASGPDSTNTSMPLNGAAPTKAEREKLGQWLACELDALNQ